MALRSTLRWLRRIPLRYVGMVLVTLAAGGAIAWLLLPVLAPPDPEKVPLPRVMLTGAELSPAGDPVAEALDRVRRYARAEVTLELPDGRKRALRPALLGAEIDRVHLAELVRAAFTAKSELVRAHQREHPDAALELPVPIRIDTERAVVALVSIKDDIDEEPVDAVVDLEKRKVVSEKNGFRLDVYGTLARIDAALARGASKVEAAVERIAPRVLASQLGSVKFDQVLGWFETRYTLGARYRARTYNLRLAASKLDGTVLLPGETFDFNETVGPRDEANGYKVAPVIAQGELVDGIGGGTCQISGTLHGAAFFAGLEIVERVPHTRPSAYIKMGLDAAVAFPSVNFRIRNPFDFPVVLHQTVKNKNKDGVVRAEILGPTRMLTVSFFRRIDEVLPFEEEVRETEELPDGERMLTQRGIPGFKTTVHRIVRDGAYATRDKISTEYPPTTQIVRVGTGGSKSKSKLKADESLEYVADEYLVLTQAPEKSDMYEERFPGKTGKRGWQKEAGMKVFDDGEGDEDEGDKDGKKEGKGG